LGEHCPCILDRHPFKPNRFPRPKLSEDRQINGCDTPDHWISARRGMIDPEHNRLTILRNFDHPVSHPFTRHASMTKGCDRVAFKPNSRAIGLIRNDELRSPEQLCRFTMKPPFERRFDRTDCSSV